MKVKARQTLVLEADKNGDVTLRMEPQMLEQGKTIPMNHSALLSFNLGNARITVKSKLLSHNRDSIDEIVDRLDRIVEDMP